VDDISVRLNCEVAREPDRARDPRGDRVVVLSLRTQSSRVAWAQVVVFGSLADIAHRLRVGDRVFVEGEGTLEFGRGGKPFYFLTARSLSPLTGVKNYPPSPLSVNNPEHRVVQ
jgi:hypothetical protein